MNIPENTMRKSREQPAADAVAWLHPAVCMLLWLFTAIAMQSLHLAPLLAIGGLLLLISLKLSALRLYSLVRRTRWIMFTLLVIYGYVTPGDALWTQGGAFSPSQEGLLDGLLQLLRLLFALSGLAIMLSVLNQSQLLGGIYVLAYPLRWLSLPRERIAVRLALTLDYGESALHDGAADWRHGIESMLEPPEAGIQEMEIHVQPYSLRDATLALLGGMLLVLAVWR